VTVAVLVQGVHTFAVELSILCKKCYLQIKVLLAYLKAARVSRERNGLRTFLIRVGLSSGSYAICMHEIYIGAVLFDVMAAAGELFFIAESPKTSRRQRTALLTRLTGIYVPSLH